ncbi:MAG: tetratricopeptide repeat protein [Planctomycetia bacterium]|nr:tetratricopeptide repeat protein [Planctomycetia bacterium]
MLSIDGSLATATRHHQAGQLAEAERIYRQILQVDPQHPHALHQLGMLALQARQFETAEQLIATAIRCDRSQASFHANLGEVYRHLQRTSEAIDCYQMALRMRPDLARVHVNLGTLLHTQGKLSEATASLRTAVKLSPEDAHARALLGRALHDQKQFAEAESCFRRVLRSSSGNPEAHFDLGSVLGSQGRLLEAAACYRTALELQGDYAEAHNNLATILRDQGSAAEAVVHYEAALKAKPDYAPALANLGAIYQDADELDKANAAYAAALRADPTLVAARNSLGTVLHRQGKLEEARTCFQEVIRSDPHFVAAHINLGNVFQAQRKLTSAIACYQDAVRIDPNQAEAYNNIGVAWSEQGWRDEAITYCSRAIELKPDFGIAYSNLAVALQALGRLDEAIACHRKAVELFPNGAGQHSNLLYALNYHPAYDAPTLFAEHRAWGQRHADPLTAQSLPHTNDRTADRRLRIGYVSPHFMGHAVNFFNEPILASHDRDQFEIFCYSDVDREDSITHRLHDYADHWRSNVGLTDHVVSESIRRDQIDILVDLTGHIGGNRMLVFARKPAPIQVTYIGYQNTTGMLAMDYRLTDEYADPPGATDAFYTERLVRLPRTFFCYLPSGDAPPVVAAPCVDQGYITFGSLNNIAKLTPDVLATWAKILAAVPGSRLILLGDMTDSLQRYLAERFAAGGIASNRLELANRRPRNEYLELIQRVDVAFDPFPFNGHTTTCDCLWQGVPVVTLSGQTYASRFGGSGLATLGLANLIAGTRDEYVQIAAGLAADVQRLKLLRGGMRERMSGSPLLDFRTFTRNLETEYRRMWMWWCAQAGS